MPCYCHKCEIGKKLLSMFQRLIDSLDAEDTVDESMAILKEQYDDISETYDEWNLSTCPQDVDAAREDAHDKTEDM